MSEADAERVVGTAEAVGGTNDEVRVLRTALGGGGGRREDGGGSGDGCECDDQHDQLLAHGRSSAGAWYVAAPGAPVAGHRDKKREHGPTKRRCYTATSASTGVDTVTSVLSGRCGHFGPEFGPITAKTGRQYAWSDSRNVPSTKEVSHVRTQPTSQPNREDRGPRGRRADRAPGLRDARGRGARGFRPDRRP